MLEKLLAFLAGLSGRDARVVLASAAVSWGTAELVSIRDEAMLDLATAEAPAVTPSEVRPNARAAFEMVDRARLALECAHPDYGAALRFVGSSRAALVRILDEVGWPTTPEPDAEKS